MSHCNQSYSVRIEKLLLVDVEQVSFGHLHMITICSLKNEAVPVVYNVL